MAWNGILLPRFPLPGNVLSLRRDVYDDIVDHALEGRPEEVCGVLGGTYDAGTSRVEVARPATNVADRPEVRYYIDPAEQLELIDELEDGGDDVVGFYHSHPTGPTNPSATDAARATWPARSYLIVALDGHPFVGSWRWNGDDERFEQEIVRIE